MGMIHVTSKKLVQDIGAATLRPQLLVMKKIRVGKNSNIDEKSISSLFVDSKYSRTILDIRGPGLLGEMGKLAKDLIVWSPFFERKMNNFVTIVKRENMFYLCIAYSHQAFYDQLFKKVKSMSISGYLASDIFKRYQLFLIRCAEIMVKEISIRLNVGVDNVTSDNMSKNVGQEYMLPRKEIGRAHV